ncbi:hypothetical protein VPEG_00017 [Vibrio phage SIO-2]|uniref:hypothetical protein n=1 Tax=Vibrio phage SIO-2 TaxID=700512 RepID=UPI0002357C37|nr:hypothetical protein VPEG_00017 [Vibrio phage SIO-2]AET42168.1 hypothetical protein VPEG_00017 [Vibrio phage SIO-2]QKE60787.1 hypothetical protein vBVhaSVHB1_100 [Vibrio phage vB_VhaS-VHB1]
MTDYSNRELVRLRVHLSDLDGDLNLGGNIDKVEVEIPARMEVSKDSIKLQVMSGTRCNDHMVEARAHTLADAVANLIPKLGFETVRHG